MKFILSIFTSCLFSLFSIGQNTWTQKANVGGGVRASGGVEFTIGNKLYIGLGQNGSIYLNDFWEYDPVLNLWTQKASFPGGGRCNAFSFSIGLKGYIGSGVTFPLAIQNDFWEFDPQNNSWIQKSNLPGNPRRWASGLTIGSYGYFGLGTDGVSTYFSDWWKYDPVNDTWIQVANFPLSNGRSGACTFTLLNNGYVCSGSDNNNFFNDLWQYDGIADLWSQKATLPALERTRAVGFAIGNFGYVGTGYNNNLFQYFNDFWEYNPFTDSWTRRADFGGTPRYDAYGSSIGNKGYLGVGVDGNVSGGYTNDFWEYGPDSSLLNIPIADFIANDSTFCDSSCISFTDQTTNNPFSWRWTFIGATPSASNLQNPSNICYLSAGTFDVTLIVTNQFGVDTIQKPGFINIGIPQIPIITRSFDTLQCTPGVTYQWLFYGDTIPGAINQTFVTTQDGIYSVIVVDSNGCQSTSALFDFSTGMTESHPMFTISPNPVAEFLLIRSIGTTSNSKKFKIISTMGIVYKEGLTTNNMIDVSDLPAQVYYLNISTKELSSNIKFIKLKN